MNPLKSLNLKLDTSLRMIFSLQYIGEKIFFCTPSDFVWFSNLKIPQVFCNEIVVDDFQVKNVQVGQTIKMFLTQFASIHMRIDPPVDDSYLTILSMLETVEKKNPYF